MRISIIIPFYNASQYVERSLLSALNQTYANIEYICVNDGSTDDSLEKIKKIAERHRRKEQVVVVEHKSNSGIAVARNTGIAHSTGDYIYFLDSDDEIPLDAIALLVSANSAYSADIVLGDFKVTGIRRSNFPPLTIPEGHIKTNKEIFDHFLSRRWPDMTCNKLEKLAFIRSYDMKFKEGILHEDALWAFELAMNASSMVVCKKETYIYHIRPDSITRKKDDKNFTSLLIILDEIIKHAFRRNLFDKYQSLIDYIVDICFFYFKELEKAGMDDEYIKQKIHKINELMENLPLNAKKRMSYASKAKLVPYNLPLWISRRLLSFLKRVR